MCIITGPIHSSCIWIASLQKKQKWNQSFTIANCNLSNQYVIYKQFMTFSHTLITHKVSEKRRFQSMSSEILNVHLIVWRESYVGVYDVRNLK
jgi:hypothetical protein